MLLRLSMELEKQAFKAEMKLNDADLEALSARKFYKFLSNIKNFIYVKPFTWFYAHKPLREHPDYRIC